LASFFEIPVPAHYKSAKIINKITQQTEYTSENHFTQKHKLSGCGLTMYIEQTINTPYGMGLRATWKGRKKTRNMERQELSKQAQFNCQR